MTGARKHSRQRDAIYEAIRSTDEHPSAEWVYAKVKNEIPDISLGTVYRNIAVFKGEGSVVSVGVVEGQERFDARTEDHAHFICERCGAVIDVDAEEVGAADAEYIMRKYGARAHRRQVRYYGLCANCPDGRE
ncbi:MAG: transcriptional repressor [Oscillospiraceae bacterium]|jgi:Fur family peroxide stress response transcriptional regulator|nr:transcriptional repressor [Oscillospiraceae bacterium]